MRVYILLAFLFPTMALAQPWTITGGLFENDQPVANTWIQFINPFEPDVVIAETETNEAGFFEFEAEEWPLDVDLTVQSVACEEIEVYWEATDEPAVIDYMLLCNPQYYEETLFIHAYPLTDDNLTWTFWTSGEGEPDAYLWTIPESSVYTTPEITHTFEESGIIPVYITASYPSGNTISLGYDVVVGIIEETNCDAYFFLAEEETDAGTGDLFFYNASIGENLEYLWDFGDGNTSEEAFPTHTFADPDQEYEVCLTIMGDGDCLDEYCTVVSGDLMSGIAENDDRDPSQFQAKDGGMTMTVLPMPTTPLGLSDLSELDFKVFPNPSNGEINLAFPADVQDRGRLTIINAQGRSVFQGVLSLSSKENTISLSPELANGVYLVRFEGNRYTLTERLVLDR